MKIHEQAFPVHNDASNGMTLRDYFAAKAMQVFIVAAISKDAGFHEEDAAIESYVMADAMLKERDA
jgi:hypothetical protein